MTPTIRRKEAVDARNGVQSRRFERVVLLLLAAVPPIVIVAWLLVLFSSLTFPLDWQSYIHGLDAAQGGRSPYAAYQLQGPYVLTDVSGGSGFVYPPSAIVVMGPFLRPYAFWAAANLALLYIGCFAILWRHGAVTPIRVAAVAWFVAVQPGVYNGVLAGDVAIATVGLFALILAGLPAWGIGIGAAVKVLPILWAPPFVRDRRALTLLVIGGVIPAAISVVLMGIGPWFDWLRAIMNGEPRCASLTSLRCLGAPAWVSYTVGGLLALAARFLGPVPAAFVLAAAILAASPDIWPHYTLFLVPPIILAFARWRPRWMVRLESRWEPSA